MKPSIHTIFHPEDNQGTNKEKLREEVADSMMVYVKKLDKLSLVCQAMWTLLQERTDVSDEDLLARVTELDLKDGILDGKYQKPPAECPSCDAMMSPKFGRCLFCGQESTNNNAFDTL